MALSIGQKNRERTWTSILIEESESSLLRRKSKRERTFRRMYMSVFVTAGAAFVTYCSLFYVGAFLDVGEVVGVSQSVRAEKAQKNVRQMQRVKKRTLFSPILEQFATNRIYMRKGQTILATYSLPSRTKLSLKIKQCVSKPVIEVFKCEVKGESRKIINNRTTGYIQFAVSEAGFYYFEDKAITPPNLKLNQDYRIVWQRGR